MYIPSHFELKDAELALQFLKTYNFATMVSIHHNLPIATHLPFVIAERGDKLFLISHFAKANMQGETFENQEVLVIFQEPHAYISPTLYSSMPNVPTWNYLAIHLYGKVNIIAGESAELALMEKMLETFEPSYQNWWGKLSDDYKRNMLKAIIAFEIEVTRFEAKAKLSQNKKEQDRENVQTHLGKSEHQSEREIADLMRKIK
jgi:transcriptional regulator